LEIKQKEDAKKLARIKHWGYEESWNGTGGGESIKCEPDPLPSDADDNDIPGKCAVVEDNGQGKIIQYIFPYNPNEWVHPPYGLDNIKKLASFKKAVNSPYKAPKEKPWVRKDGNLAKGQHCAVGRLCNSQWNDDKNNYDNFDIGPNTPVCWTFAGGMFPGLEYNPCNPQDERRSTPGSEWTLDVQVYGYQEQASPGWTESECKALMPNYLTGFTFGMQGQDPESLNRGNLKEVRCFQQGSYPIDGRVLLKPRTQPPAPPGQAATMIPQSLPPGTATSITSSTGSVRLPSDINNITIPYGIGTVTNGWVSTSPVSIGQQPEIPCVQGGTLAPGQSCVFAVGR
jgi:hypothetical protein